MTISRDCLYCNVKVIAGTNVVIENPLDWTIEMVAYLNSFKILVRIESTT